jgi:hypothetical protein
LSPVLKQHWASALQNSKLNLAPTKSAEIGSEGLDIASLSSCYPIKEINMPRKPESELLRSAIEPETIDLETALLSEGNDYVLPSANSPSERWYRVSKRDVVLLEQTGQRQLTAEQSVPVFRVRIAATSRCVRMESEPVASIVTDLAEVKLLRTPTPEVLENAVGKNISVFCGNGFHDNAQNHCAHFVGHILGISVGTTCEDIVGGSEQAASIRVHELFANCRQMARWQDLPSPLLWGLVFITNAANVNLATKTMQNVPKKHVGIFYGAGRDIYQYKNAVQHVVKQTPTEFGQHYSSPDNALFFGTL